MRKYSVKRFGIKMLQHIFVSCIMTIIALIVYNSYVTVTSMDGTNTYLVNSFDSKQTFEESQLFTDIFSTAVSDITRLVVIKEQLETDGMFDPSKIIDVTEYADHKGTNSECPITVKYELDNLIKWGKYGVEFKNRTMSLSDFVNYFHPIYDVRNFALDESGRLYFRGFFNSDIPNSEDNWKEFLDPTTVLTREEKRIVGEMREQTKEQLDDLAFTYIITKIPQGIQVFREDDNTLNVNITLLNCQYETIDREKQLLTYADNWVDYMKLQNNLVDSINSLTKAYQAYVMCNGLYLENASNLKYAIRITTSEGVRTYTNVSELEYEKENEITDYFGEFRRYFIYYPDSLEFSSNTKLTEEDIYTFMKEYKYAYPDTTHIWVGVDTAYQIKSDAFYNANEVYNKITPHKEIFIAGIGILMLFWIGICIYLTTTTGVQYDDEEGEQRIRLNVWDYLWTELFIIAIIGAFWVGSTGFKRLMEFANEVQLQPIENMDVLGSSWMYRYGMFAVYGFCVSVIVELLWLSFVRRVRGKNLLSSSFVVWGIRYVRKGLQYVFQHTNTAISTLIPYNFFLLMNLMIAFGLYMFREKSGYVFAGLLVIVIFDGAVGTVLFKKTAEKMDIIEGIRRIRDGEVDYKLDVTNLHGVNREMADAVNNIGDGIHKAVKTSMKNEQMKTDLITNVSHDLKTPLTSIISYVDLLKRTGIEEEPAKTYLEVLENKSQRLKQLTDDLVEVSKISSGNIELHREKIDLQELLQQSIGEFVDKLEEKNLQIVYSPKKIPAYIFADSRRMWRIIENLFHNIYKYAMESTRVYIELDVQEGRIILSFKNISEKQMNVNGEDLTERFIRGDDSRTTEGAGLGLSIAKSLTEVQGGNFSISLDGDLFKVLLVFSEYREI